MKTLDDYFADWEAHVFGYGYGTGEPHVIPALTRFMGLVPDEGSYHYEALEDALDGAVAWLLINVLAHADLIEYGTSPRFAWLTPQGRALKDYLRHKTDAEVLAVLDRADDYVHCYPDHCNCQDEDCNNPFWRTITPRGNCREVPR